MTSTDARRAGPQGSPDHDRTAPRFRSGRSWAERGADWIRAHPLLPDTVIAAAVIGLGLSSARDLGPAELTVAVVAGSSLVLRRTRPMLGALVVLACGLATVGFGLVAAVVTPAVLVTVYSLAAWGPRRTGLLAAGVAVLGGAGVGVTWLLTGLTAQPWGVFLVLLVGATLASATAWLGGALRRVGRREVVHLQERAALLETEQAQRERLATLAERARISREMHDIIAHSLSVIVVQADGGRIAAGAGQTAQATRVLDTIAQTGRGALADVRALLGLLHDQQAEGAPPQPGLDAVPGLVEEFGGTLRVTGTARLVPAGLGLTAYRAVQEALTNTLKHAGRPATVVLAWLPEHLEIDVTDDGPTGPTPGGSLGGHGLSGMRERVAAHGGEVEAGPRPEGGFRVHVRLPA
jgi:signal transduction histidine kinase